MTADPNSREVGNQLAIDGIQVESDALAATADVDFCDREQESRSSSSPKVSNLEPSPVSRQETRPLWEYIWGIGSNIEGSVDKGRPNRIFEAESIEPSTVELTYLRNDRHLGCRNLDHHLRKAHVARHGKML